MNILNLENTEALQHLREKVEKVGVAMMSTAKQNGHPKARPMHTLDFDDHGGLWFFSFVNSKKVEDLSDNDLVNLIYAKPEDGIYVSITGHAQIVTDEQKIQDYWQDRFRAWIPNGPQSPGLYLIKINAVEGESWDIDTNKVIRFFKETKARMQGEVYSGGEHLAYTSKEHEEV